MYGEDKSKIVELQSTVSELEGLKIEILPKAEKVNELNTSIEKMEAQIKQIDEELLDNIEMYDDSENTTSNNQKSVGSTQLQVDSNGQLIDSGNEEDTDDLEIVFSEDSNFNILVSNIEILTEDINEAVKEEADRKAEEERKAKEEADKKAKEQALANVVNGDFTYFAGTYYNEYNPSETLVLDKSGKVTIAGRVFANKPISIVKESNGAYWCLTQYGELDDNGFKIYPIGVSGGGSDITNKVRLVVLENLGATTYIKK